MSDLSHPSEENDSQLNALLTAWKNIFGLDEAGPDDDFFASGGTSLTAIKLESALFEQGWILSASDIFQHSTIRNLAGMMLPADEIDWEAEE